MQWIIENWILLLVGGGLVAMHLFSHGHKGKHKKKDHNSGKMHRSPDLKATDEAKESSND